MKKQDPVYLVDLLKKNIDNERLDDAAFRELIRASLDLYRSSSDEQSIRDQLIAAGLLDLN